MTLSVAALTHGANVPSARFRVSQYVGELARLQVAVTEYPARVSSYPPASRLARPAWAVGELVKRSFDVIRTYRHDAVILQRELISTIPTLEPLTRRPRIFDVDDAIWIHRGGWAADTIAAKSDQIVCGNRYIADHFAALGRPITIIPTAVDTRRFRPREDRSCNGIVGWSGSSSGFGYLNDIQNQLATVLTRNPDWRLRIVSDRPPTLPMVPPRQLEYLPWSAETEARAIAEMDIGLMPLDDSTWSRGKCSYKMLLYQASGVSVVVSDVGMNAEILRMANLGRGVPVSKPEAWVDAIQELMDDDHEREATGHAGRRIAESEFRVDKLARRWAEVLHEATR